MLNETTGLEKGDKLVTQASNNDPALRETRN